MPGQALQNQVWTWSAVLYDGTHTLADSAGLSLSVHDPTGALASGFPVVSPAIIHDSLGKYHYPWTVPAVAMQGVWSAVWSGTLTITGTLATFEDNLNVTAGYCSLLDVKQRLSGDVPNMDTKFDATLTTHIIDTCDGINSEIASMRAQPDGYTILPGAPTSRRYTGYPGGSDLLYIDDAIAVSSVAILDTQGNLYTTLVSGNDYLPYSGMGRSGLPIIGLKAISTGQYPMWPEWYGAVQVSLTPGYALSTPPDLHDVAITESVRSYMSARSGDSGSGGVSPLGGATSVSDSFTPRSARILNRYARRAAWFRS